MASVWIDAIWRGQSVTAGVAKTKQELSGLSGEASKLWAEIGGVRGLFAFGGIVAGVQAARVAISDGVTGTLDWEAAAQRTTGTLENLGKGGTAAFEEVERAVNRVVATTRYGDDALLDAANNLIEGTQDVAGSLRNLSLVADLAAARQIDLASASQIVAKVMEGNNRAVGQMLPFLRTYAESLEGIADPAERAELMIRKLLETVGGKAADELKTGRGAWLDYKDAFGEAMEALVVKSGALAAITTQVRELTRELTAMQNTGSGENLSGFDKSVLAAVMRAFPALAKLNAENAALNNGPVYSEGATAAFKGQQAWDAANAPMLGPGNEEGAAKFAAVVEEWRQAVEKWSIENGISDDRQTMRRPGMRGRSDLGRDLAGGRKAEPLDEESFDPGGKKAKELAQSLQSSISAAFIAGGEQGWAGILASLKSTGLDMLAQLLSGAIVNAFAPGAGVLGPLGAILHLGGSGTQATGAGLDNANRRLVRVGG